MTSGVKVAAAISLAFVLAACKENKDNFSYERGRMTIWEFTPRSSPNVQCVFVKEGVNRSGLACFNKN